MDYFSICSHVESELLKSVSEISTQTRGESKSEAGRLSTGISTRTSVEIAGLLYDGFGLDEAGRLLSILSFLMMVGLSLKGLLSNS